jgi:hypothetical protein
MMSDGIPAVGNAVEVVEGFRRDQRDRVRVLRRAARVSGGGR